MISFKQKGDFKNMDKFLNRNRNFIGILEKYAVEGMNALKNATPIDSGKTANSWTYSIKYNKKSISIVWSNTNVVNGVPVAILIQYGHATATGQYVQGTDFINPSMKPIFEKMSDELWKMVKK